MTDANEKLLPLGDLPSRLMGWIGKARSQGRDRIEISLETASLVLSALSAPRTPSEPEFRIAALEMAVKAKDKAIELLKNEIHNLTR